MSVHENDSLLILEGNYVTHCARGAQATDVAAGDEAAAEGAAEGAAERGAKGADEVGADGEVRERTFHVHAAVHVRAIAPFVRRAVCVQRNQHSSRARPGPDSPPATAQRTVEVPGALVAETTLPAAHLAAYSDGTVRGRFADRTIAKLVPRAHAGGGWSPRTKLAAVGGLGADTAGFYACCELLLPTGEQTAVPVDPSDVGARAFISHIQLLVRFGRWAFASEAERAAAEEEGRERRAAVASQQRKTDVALRLLRARAAGVRV